MIIPLNGLLSASEAAALVAAAPAAPPGEIARQLEAALGSHDVFNVVAAARQMGSPELLRLAPGDTYQDPFGAVVRRTGMGDPLRLDLIVSVFLSPPDSYDGGELIVTHAAGAQSVKLGAGDAIVYPASSSRRVDPVTGGVRWTVDLPVQSMVRDDTQREILTEIWSVADWLDQLPPEAKGHTSRARTALDRARRDLLRMWIDV